MKLMTKEIEKKIPALYAQDGKGMEATVHVKFFFPIGCATWLATEYDPEQRLFFGWAMLQPGCGELGYFSLDELESVSRGGVKVERDLYFGTKTLKEAIADYQ